APVPLPSPARRSSDLHGLILAALGNDVVREAYEQTHAHLHTFRLYAADIDGSVTLAEHTRIWEAIDACDADAAEAAMRRHLTKRSEEHTSELQSRENR